MEIIREISPLLLRTAQYFPVLVLTGARQTGKTTVLRSLFPKHRYVSLDLPSLALQAEQDPTLFLAQNPPPLLIDEVQYAPGLFRHIKRVVDEDRHTAGQFILTGSQKFPLMKEVSDSLAGRAVLFELDGLSLHELASPKTDIAATMARGFFPELWRVPDLPARAFYSSYVATYLERDVRQILNVTSLRDFERFMRMTAARSGQVLNKTDLARDVGLSTKAIADWIAVLQASNQIVLLEPYFQNISKRSVKSPKLYWCDPGLLCFLLNLDEHTVSGSPMVGAIFETLVLAELRKRIAANSLSSTLYFYRDQRAREVDFVIDGGGTLTFAEVKWTEQPTIHDAHTIRALDAELRASSLSVRPGRHAVISRTHNSYPLVDDIRALPPTEAHSLLT